MSIKPPITVSSFDLERIEQLMASATHRKVPGLDGLQLELNRADIVAPNEVPANVITMNSKVRFLDDATNTEYDLTLVYPSQANLPDTVSILAPVGSALLGMSVGQRIEWPVPSGQTMKLRVLSIVYQPEAQGDFLM